MCRSARIQSRVSSGARAAAGRRRDVMAVYVAITLSARGREAGRAGRREPLLRPPRAKRVVLHQPCRLGGGELRLCGPARRGRNSRAGGARLELDAWNPFPGRHEDSGLAEQLRPGRGIEGRTNPCSAAERPRERRARPERAGAEDRELPVRLGDELARERPEQRAFGRSPLEHDELALPRGVDRIDTEGDELVAAREALGCRLRGLLTCR